MALSVTRTLLLLAVFGSNASPVVIGRKQTPDGPRKEITARSIPCRHYYFGNKGLILSPDWPRPYPNNADCKIWISVSSGRVISLFFRFFCLEQNPLCHYDYLQIYEGWSNSAPRIGRYCGCTKPDPVFASGDELYMEFKSDMFGTSGGFAIAYTSSVGGCNQTFNSAEGRILSPGWPGKYPNNMACKIKVTGKAGSKLRLSFNSLDLEFQSGCAYDNLQIFDGPDNAAPLIGRYCGNTKPPTVNATGSQLYIEFRTNERDQADGFDMFYISIEN